MTAVAAHPRISTRRTSRAAATPYLFVWFLYFPLSAFYVFPSGTPQPADFLLVCLFGFRLFHAGLRPPKSARAFLLGFLVFAAYVCAVNSAWWAAISSVEILAFSLFYVFNLMACLLFADLYDEYRDAFLQWTARSAICSACLQTGLTFFYSTSGREALFFNNPNQLGHYAVLIGSIYWIIVRTKARRSAMDLPIFAAVCMMFLYLIVLTQSRAAMAAFVVLLVLQCITKIRFALVVAGVVMLFSNTYMDSTLVGTVLERIQIKNKTSDEEMEHRGYDRIFNHKEYLLLGAGEGDYERFDSECAGELHSTFGNVFFSYGAVGILLLANVFRNFVKRCGLHATIYLLPALAYGLTHNGIRQPDFWMTVTLITCVCARKPDVLPRAGAVGTQGNSQGNRRVEARSHPAGRQQAAA